MDLALATLVTAEEMRRTPLPQHGRWVELSHSQLAEREKQR
ncbi:hypothetical protein V3589_11400 [Sinorhizobium fredii]